MGSEDDRAYAQCQAAARCLAEGHVWDVWRCTTCYLHLPLLLADEGTPRGRCPLCGGLAGRWVGGAARIEDVARVAEQGREWRP